MKQILERVWERMGLLSISAARERVMLRPRQEQLLKLRGQSGGMVPPEVWAALKVSKQGAMDMLRPLLKAGFQGCGAIGDFLFHREWGQTERASRTGRVEDCE